MLRGGARGEAELELEPIRPSAPDAGSEAGSASTELDVHVSAHRLRCRKLCGTTCLTGPKEDGCDVQLVFFALISFAIVVYAALAAFLLGRWYPFLAALPGAFMVLHFLAFALCALTDPGVVPPAGWLDETQLTPATRACRKCNLLQDPTTRHCTYCDACIRGLDHHCGITGNCVGSRNSVHFAFLFFYFVASFWTGLISVVFMGVCQAEAARHDFSGSFSPALDVAAAVVSALMAVVLASSIIIYALAYCGKLGRLSPVLSRTLCRSPMSRPGSDLLSSDLPREPLCCAGTSLCACFTVPFRDFYPRTLREDLDLEDDDDDDAVAEA